MSVFQLQDWWSVQISQDEEFDSGCMAVGNIDNAVPPMDKIAIGSQSGILRIYNPMRPQYRVDDLILEESLNQPILQLLIGQFIPSDDHLALAVLHPKKLLVFEVNPQGGKEGRNANYYSLRKCYEHNLGIEGNHFTAYNMISGGFGGVRSRDMFMVQSMDGKLQIFEQSANAFTRQLVECLYPCPLLYLSSLDAFMITNHASQAECYRYHVLANSQADLGQATKETTDKFTTGAFGLSAVRSALVEWSVNLGEGCRQLVEGYFSGADNDSRGSAEILALCDRSLFLLKASGGVMQQRRLENDPACLCAYRSAGGGKASNFLLALRDATIQVYSQFNLVWAAKCPAVPVQMEVGTFGGVHGLVVTVDDNGRLAISYLGTKPPVASVVSQSRDLDYDKVDEEHRSLLKIIRESQSDGGKVEPKERLLIRSQIARSIDSDNPVGELPPDVVSFQFSGVTGRSSGATGGRPLKICVRVYISFTGNASLNDVTLVVATPSFVHAVPKNVILSKVAGVQSTPTMLKIYFYSNQSFMPTSFDVQITASYLTSIGEPRTMTHSLQLPLLLACRPRAALKTGVHKFTLDTSDMPAQALTDLFDDVLFAYTDAGLDVADSLGSSAAQAMGFQFWAKGNATSAPSNTGKDHETFESIPTNNSSESAVVSILVSKTAGRYRVQSDSLAAMLTVIRELNTRLNLRRKQLAANIRDNADATSMKATVMCSDPLPLQEYFSVIDDHFSIRHQMQDIMSRLNDGAHQFRVVQKRLLVRFKDKNPTPLAGLDALLKESYDTMLAEGDRLQDLQTRLSFSAGELECLSRLVSLLTTLRFGLSAADHTLLDSFLCVGLNDTTHQGWEETVETSLTYLLKTHLAKTVKETTSLASSTFELPQDTAPLKKHISMVIDRIGKAGGISRSGSSIS